MCGLFLTVKLSCLFTAVAVLVCLRSLILVKVGISGYESTRISQALSVFFRYNSGGKEFSEIPAKSFSLSVDGFTLQKSCWQSNKPSVSSKTVSNYKASPYRPTRWPAGYSAGGVKLRRVKSRILTLFTDYLCIDVIYLDCIYFLVLRKKCRMLEE